jgi:hypothetical protein
VGRVERAVNQGKEEKEVKLWATRNGRSQAALGLLVTVRGRIKTRLMSNAVE